jgi:hypothetical protein
MTNAVPDTKYKYAFALHRNARAFIESTVDYARRDMRDEWKFALLHLNTALELILKARLAIEDHRRLAAGKTQVTDRQFDEGTFQSVGIDECIERLTQTGKFALDTRQCQAIKALQHLRNRIAHYIDPDNTAAIKAVVAAGLNLFIDIDNAEFQGEDPYGARNMRELAVDLHKCGEFVKERMASLAPRLRSATRPRTHYTDECSFCLQDAAIINGDEVTCLFCGHGMELREFAETRSEDGSVELCPDCGRPSVLKDRRKDDEPTSECLVCGWFCGSELTWSHRNGQIPRLHPNLTLTQSESIQSDNSTGLPHGQPFLRQPGPPPVSEDPAPAACPAHRIMTAVETVSGDANRYSGKTGEVIGFPPEW